MSILWANKMVFYQTFIFLVPVGHNCTTKRIMYGIVLVKNVRLVSTLKQNNFSFPVQTAVSSDLDNLHFMSDFPHI